MPVYKGAYGPDYKEGSLGGDLNYMRPINLTSMLKIRRLNSPVRNRL